MLKWYFSGEENVPSLTAHKAVMDGIMVFLKLLPIRHSKIN
jgi:hypothetical protein